MISFRRSRYAVHYNHNIGGVCIQRANYVKDLGVVLDTKVTFDRHAEEVIIRGNQLLRFVLHMAKDVKDSMCLKAIYCSIIRPVLEYTNLLWKPLSQRLSDRLETILRKLSRYAVVLLLWDPGSEHPPCDDRLMLLDLHQLEDRRQIVEQLFVAGLLTDNIDSPILLQPLDLYVLTVPLRPRPLIAIPRRRKKY